MSFACLTNYLAENFAPVLEQFSNGEYRLVNLRDAVQTDARGFPDSDYVPRRQAFAPCSWIAKRALEKEVAEAVRGLDFYEISCTQKTGDGLPVIVETGDRVELRLKKGDSSVKTLEVVSVVNQSNLVWTIWAIDEQ